MVDKSASAKKSIVRVEMYDFGRAWVVSILFLGITEHHGFATEREARAYAVERARLLLDDQPEP
ncbi:hypothetical protein [Pararhizobium arenae]|uniref:hypothetical protein n=1 Tax=Pararhizobium arenae TaxID=1856850 RepID=UPI00094ADAC5|nr:hypothetical protein [Pararhizobium arenae]